MDRNARAKSRRAGIYVRVSQDRSGDETTTQRQEADCRDHCRLKGWTVADVYRDVDLSAYDPKVTRPQFERLKADVESGRIDAIVFWKLDRLARRTRDVIDVLDLLEDYHAAMASVQDSFDTSTPSGRGMVQLMATMAEIASADTSARVKRAKLAEAKGGLNPGGGNLPFGWKVNTVERVHTTATRTCTRHKTTETADGTTVCHVPVSSAEADPKQAEALREVARRFLDQGESLNRLAAELKARDFRTPPSAKSPNGKAINAISLRNILASPRLAGYRVHRPKAPFSRKRRTEDEPVTRTKAVRDKTGAQQIAVDLYPTTAWEAIIDDDTFRRLQERFGNRVIETEDGTKLVMHGTERRKVSTERHLLTGFIWCGRCGDERMRLMRNKKNGVRYVCRGCASITIGQDVAERHVVKEALMVLMGRRMLGDDRPEVDAASLEAELERLRGKMRDLTMARFVADDPISDDEFVPARAALQERIVAVEGRRAHAREMQVGPIAGTPFEGFDSWWETATLDERRRTLEGAVSRIVVAPFSHDLARLFRRPGVEVDPSRPVLTGVPMERRDDLARARITIEWRPEVLPTRIDPSEPFPPKAKPPTRRQMAKHAEAIASRR